MGLGFIKIRGSGFRVYRGLGLGLRSRGARFLETRGVGLLVSQGYTGLGSPKPSYHLPRRHMPAENPYHREFAWGWRNSAPCFGASRWYHSCAIQESFFNGNAEGHHDLTPFQWASIPRCFCCSSRSIRWLAELICSLMQDEVC